MITRTETAFRATLVTDDFAALCEQVRRISGIDLSQYKRGQMERRVRTFAQRRGTPDLAAYGARLKAEPAELDAFLDRVTINVSHLWRHEDQFIALARHILPELTATRNRVRVWSAGSSYGAEAYTIAAVARDAVPGGARGDRGHGPRPPDGRQGARRPLQPRGRPDRPARRPQALVRPGR